MDMVRQVIVFDAADLRAESAFWAGILGGHVFEDDDWHSVIDAAGQWRIGVQLAPNHVPPEWPHGTQQQQVHPDLHVEDQRAAHDQAMALGARLLQPAPDFDAPEGHQVYADPAGHPFCVGWGHPSRERLAAFVADRLGHESQGTEADFGIQLSRAWNFDDWKPAAPTSTYSAAGGLRQDPGRVAESSTEARTCADGSRGPRRRRARPRKRS